MSVHSTTHQPGKEVAASLPVPSTTAHILGGIIEGERASGEGAPPEGIFMLFGRRCRRGGRGTRRRAELTCQLKGRRRRERAEFDRDREEEENSLSILGWGASIMFLWPLFSFCSSQLPTSPRSRLMVYSTTTTSPVEVATASSLARPVWPAGLGISSHWAFLLPGRLCRIRRFLSLTLKTES